VGEAYDKISRWLGLGYPGGPVLDRMAKEGDAAALVLPRSMRDGTLDFSLSGLKTAVTRSADGRSDVSPSDVAASFQAAVVEQLIRKTAQALDEHDVRSLTLGGGVAANSALRAAATELAAQHALACYLPSLSMCTDNAAMIAAAGLYRLRADGPSSLDVPARPNWTLAQL
jgi:N6-L-threonylcarbamoyladenine synthase